ncbi:MAG TPA: hypothetical protein VKA46_40965 [Gemmataceae bacterium]|nr:hypothetical protein [Gemmataceae bacterium]
MAPSFKDPLPPATPGPFREGDRVRLRWGGTPVEGIVIEDRRNRGVEGKRFYRVRVRLDDISEPIEIERPADKLTLVARGTDPDAQGAAGEAPAIMPTPSYPFEDGESRTAPSFKDPLKPLTPGPFREGDRVRLLWGVTPVEGIVIEDRGNRGVGGKRSYRVRVPLDDVSEPMESEWPAEDLTLVARAPTRSRKGRPAKRPR